MKTCFSILYMALFITIVSCKPKARSKSEYEQINDSEQNDSAVVLVDSTEQKLSSLLEQFRANKESMLKKLSKINAKEANKLYESYLKANSEFLAKIDSSELWILSKFYYEEAKAIIKKKSKILGQYGLEFWEIGEGYVEIRTVHDYYYRIFKDYVTSDYRDYLDITQEENKHLFAADAGLSISFQDLGKRVVKWEEFMYKYPNSTLITKAKEIYQYYQLTYLLGMDNTPTIESWQGDKDAPYIFEENLKEFRSFIAKYPNSPTTKLVEYLLANFNDENIYSLLSKMQEELLKDFPPQNE
ncbi:MAG: hypothetical protein Q4A56_04350 [Porphyromonadaceae bacterium]|nr:hypothetical protein [Porphyromonadaceae bacterium]